MSSKGAGHHLASGATARDYETIDAVLTINSMQEDGVEFWWAMVPGHANISESVTDTIYVEMRVHGKNPETFAWDTNKPAKIRGGLASKAHISLTDDGRCKIVIDPSEKNKKGDLILRIKVDGQLVKLDPEVDVGMPGAH